jgi:hypothetical protein
MDAVRERVARLSEMCRERERDISALRLSVALQSGQPGDLAELARLGVNELVLVESPPENPDEAEQWVAALARRWQPPTRGDTDR